MRRFRIPEVAIGFLVATVFWLVVAAIYPQHNAAKSEPHQGTPKIATTEAETNQRIANYNEALDWLTAFLVAANLALWWAPWRGSVRQSRDMKASIAVATQSADAAKLNAQAVIDGERAHLYVIVTRHDVREIIDSVSGAKYSRLDPTETIRGPVLAYIFQNSGKTPAILEEVMHGMTIQETEKHAIHYETPDRALEVLGVDQATEDIAVGFDERAFLARDAKALGDHTLMLFFYSAATFRDIFNRQHKIRHDFLYSAGRFHLINRIEKTYDAPKQGDEGEQEQTSRTGFFGRPTEG